MIIESCHEYVPPEEVKPITDKIIANFVTEYCNNQHITIGLNTIREILTRMPLAVDEAQIEYLVQFRTFRNASVVNAAKSLVNFFRDVCPNLLPKKFRGRFTKIDDDNNKESLIYGKQKLNYDIDGLDLLRKAEHLPEGTNIAAHRILDDNDLKKIRYLKLKAAVKKVDRKGFADSGDEKEAEGDNHEEAEGEDDGEEIVFDDDEDDDEEGEEIGEDEDDGDEDDEDDGDEDEEDDEYGSEEDEEEEEVPVKNANNKRN